VRKPFFSLSSLLILLPKRINDLQSIDVTEVLLVSRDQREPISKRNPSDHGIRHHHLFLSSQFDRSLYHVVIQR
jgi:hypothetical protein